MELRHLRYFVAVAEAQSLTRAAARLGIQQPPLGQQIRALEDELQVSLFDRAARKVKLNATGEVFLARARDILASADAAIEHVRRFDSGEAGALRVGFTSSASVYPMTPNLIRTFHHRYPRAQIQVEESETYRLVLGLREGRVDAAFLHVAAERYGDLSGCELAHEEVVLAAPAGHRLASPRSGRIPLSKLDGERFIVYRRPDGPGIMDTLLPQLEAAGVRIKIVRQVTRLVAAINLVAANEGLTLVPETMMCLHAHAVDYRKLRRGDLRPLPLCLLTRKDRNLPILQNFIKIVEEAAPLRLGEN